MRIEIIAKRTAPLCFMPDGSLVCYKDGYLMRYDGMEFVFREKLFVSFKEQWMGKIKLINRLLRLGIRSAIALNNEVVLLSLGNMIYEYDFTLKTLSNGFSLIERIRPLVFTELKGIVGFQDSIVFGGYLNNSAKSPVHIYRRRGIDDWEIVYTFQHGCINHVHNLVPDPYNNCLWAFTGDFDDAAAIWKIENDFKIVNQIYCGNQNYRGCVCYATKEGILYATDTPFCENHIFLMKEDKLEIVGNMKGSCIYGCRIKDGYVFSSTVEGDGCNQTRMQLLFNNKPGKGITDRYVHLCIGSPKKSFVEILKLKKDCAQFLFQFGVFKFPQGVNKTESIYCQPVATQKYDLDLIRLTNY